MRTELKTLERYAQRLIKQLGDQQCFSTNLKAPDAISGSYDRHKYPGNRCLTAIYIWLSYNSGGRGTFNRLILTAKIPNRTREKFSYSLQVVRQNDLGARKRYFLNIENAPLLTTQMLDRSISLFKSIRV